MDKLKWVMKCFIFLLIVLAGVKALANITLPSVIGSNMVLQQKATVKLWGWGHPTEKVVITTSWNEKKDSTVVMGNAKWELLINTPVAGGPYFITIQGYNTILLENVLIGEVWICSGQSNMEYNFFWGSPQIAAEFADAAKLNLRFLSVPKITAETPQEDIKAQWTLCDSNTLKSFSAVAYYFGKQLNRDLDVPIGLINASWSGTPAEVWTPADSIQQHAVLSQAAAKQGKSNGWPIVPRSAYNGMIAPLARFRIAGFIWYQGESNTITASQYGTLFSTLIQSWREAWKDVLPFYFVQLAPFRYGQKNVAALLREQQANTLVLPQTGMVVTTDLADDTLDIHPKNKRDVGARLAKMALVNTYGKEVASAESPSFQSFEVHGKVVTLLFNHAGEGLMHKGAKVTGMYIAGAHQQFYPAEVKVEKNKIKVWSHQVAKPVAVRYAFSNTAVGNLFNSYGMPVAPFRTDEWKIDTSKQ